MTPLPPDPDIFASPNLAPLFEGAPAPVLKAMMAGSELRHLQAGERLLAMGDENDVLFLVLEGTLQVRIPGASRALVPVTPGECVGELSLIDGFEVSADVFADGEALVLAIEREQLWHVIEVVPVVARNLLRMLAKRVRNDNRRLQAADRLQRKYEKAATVDALTGLRNRRWLNEAFERQLQRTLRSDQPVSVLMIDADHFKHVNDTHGHIVGDEVLVHIGRTLAAGLRPQDLLARYGGEEFAVLLPNVPHGEALAAADRLRRAVETNPPQTSAGVLLLPPVTVSIGVATMTPIEPLALQQLVDRADSALGRAKAAGRNCIRG